MIKTLKSLQSEYGIKWMVNRSVFYEIKMLSIMPVTEKAFERTVSVKRVNIFNFNVSLIKHYLNGLAENKRKYYPIADKN